MEIKISNDELKANRPTISENRLIPKIPIYFLIENVRSVHNVGSIFRSADGFGANMIYLTGYTAYPPREDLSKTALGSENAVPWIYLENPIEMAEKIKKATHSKSKISHVPLPEDDPKIRQPDITLAKKYLNWEPEVSLDQGLQSTLEYFKNQLKT